MASSSEHHLEVARTARYHVLGNEDAAEVWFVLHGYKQLAGRFLRRFEPIDDGARLLVAPEALSRFYVSQEQGRHGAASVVGATWMTREDRENEIRDYVGYLDRLADVILSRRTEPPSRLVVLGFSQGVATATRWVVQGSVQPTQLVCWGDFTPPDLDVTRASERLAAVDVVMVRGDADRALSPALAEAEAERLGAAGIEHRRLTYEGGHEIEVGALRRLVGD